MKISIIAYELLDWYLEILSDYDFQPTEYLGYKIWEYDKPISKGTIEVKDLDDLFELSKKLHLHHKAKKCKDDDLIIIRYVKNEFLLEIYDGYRE